MYTHKHTGTHIHVHTIIHTCNHACTHTNTLAHAYTDLFTVSVWGIYGPSHWFEGVRRGEVNFKKKFFYLYHLEVPSCLSMYKCCWPWCGICPWFAALHWQFDSYLSSGLFISMSLCCVGVFSVVVVVAAAVNVASPTQFHQKFTGMGGWGRRWWE